jgi:hypothetical protein
VPCRSVRFLCFCITRPPPFRLRRQHCLAPQTLVAPRLTRGYNSNSLLPACILYISLRPGRSLVSRLQGANRCSKKASAPRRPPTDESRGFAYAAHVCFKKLGSICIDGGLSLLMNTGRSVCDLNRHTLSLFNTHSLMKSATIGGFD